MSGKINLLFKASRNKKLLEISGTVWYVHMNVEIPAIAGEGRDLQLIISVKEENSSKNSAKAELGGL